MAYVKKGEKTNLELIGMKAILPGMEYAYAELGKQIETIHRTLGEPVSFSPSESSESITLVPLTKGDKIRASWTPERRAKMAETLALRQDKIREGKSAAQKRRRAKQYRDERAQRKSEA
jgi:hypothetical protein